MSLELSIVKDILEEEDFLVIEEDISSIEEDEFRGDWIAGLVVWTC